MARLVTISTGQWAGLGLEEMCRAVKDVRYERLEITSQSQIGLQKAAGDPGYIRGLEGTLEKYRLECWAIGAHLPDQCVGDVWDPRLDEFVPAEPVGKPDEVRAWGIQRSKHAAIAAGAMGVEVVIGFMGSLIWKTRYSFPQTIEKMVEAGFQQTEGLWAPAFDMLNRCGAKSALGVHPTEITLDYCSTRKLLEVFEYRETLGINFDPSHLIQQGTDPAMFLYDLVDRVYHVHIKNTAVNLNGRNGALGSHITFGDPRQGWSLVSPGHGDMDFNKVIRIPNVRGYDGPLPVEQEDSGIDHIFRGIEACAFTKEINLSPSATAFDDALKTK